MISRWSRSGAQAALVRMALLSAAAALAQPALADDLTKWAASPHRTPANVARDPARHPLEVLRFFEVRDTSVVVEILPGSTGYYLEILAPYLKARGRYVAASRADTAPPQYVADHRKLLARLQAEPALYDRVVVTAFDAGKLRDRPGRQRRLRAHVPQSAQLARVRRARGRLARSTAR